MDRSRTLSALISLLLAAGGLVGFLSPQNCQADEPAKPLLELKDGPNCIALVGGGFIEQSRLTGYIETRLLRDFPPDQPVIFRNLGWSGDSVRGDARTPGYEEPAGLDRLVKEATALKPTAILVGYGLVESFEGEAGLAKFSQGYNTMLDALQKLTPNLILLSPTFHEDQPGQSTEAATHNAALKQYTAAIATIATGRKLPFVDLYQPLIDFKTAHPTAHLTSNGITLSDAGYWLVAAEIERQLALKTPAPHQQEITTAPATSLLPFQWKAQALPAPAIPADLSRAGLKPHDQPALRLTALGPGNWTLLIDNNEIVTTRAEIWATGVTLPTDPDQAQVEQLRQAIIHSNELFYRRSRPFNDHSRHWTYISGDYALYDHQLADLDQQIEKLRHPTTHDCRIVKQFSTP